MPRSANRPFNTDNAYEFSGPFPAKKQRTSFLRSYLSFSGKVPFHGLYTETEDRYPKPAHLLDAFVESHEGPIECNALDFLSPCDEARNAVLRIDVATHKKGETVMSVGLDVSRSRLVLRTSGEEGNQGEDVVEYVPVSLVLGPLQVEKEEEGGEEEKRRGGQEEPQQRTEYVVMDDSEALGEGWGQEDEEDEGDEGDEGDEWEPRQRTEYIVMDHS